MTANQQLQSALGGVGLTAFTPTLKDVRVGSAVTARLDLKADGSIIETGNQSTCTPAFNWALPINAANGDQCWVQLTLNTGTAPTSGTVGSRLALSTSPFWSWGRGTVGTTAATCTLDFFFTATGGASVYSTPLPVTCTMS